MQVTSWDVFYSPMAIHIVLTHGERAALKSVRAYERCSILAFLVRTCYLNGPINKLLVSIAGGRVNALIFNF